MEMETPCLVGTMDHSNRKANSLRVHQTCHCHQLVSTHHPQKIVTITCPQTGERRVLNLDLKKYRFTLGSYR
jgi:hypothetical protein